MRSDPPSPAPTTVLLVLRSTLVRQLLAAVLRSRDGVSVSGQCGSAADARALCVDAAPRLMIVDTALPDGSGFDLVRRLGPAHPGTRFLLLSDHERSALVADAVASGAHGMVMASQPMDLLVEAIQALLSGRSYYCPTSSRLLLDRLSGAYADSPAHQLTTRERQVLQGFAEGKSVKLMADDMSLSSKTVGNHLTQLKEKLGIYEPIGLLRYAVRHGLVEMTS